MSKKADKNTASNKAWFIDQLAKSAFFHQKLHEWQLVEAGEKISKVKGEKLLWDKTALGISESAWNKLIHRGIKPVLVFAHPEVLQTVAGSVAYYRMLAMVSQKSMNRIGAVIGAYESGKRHPNDETSLFLAAHLNQIISHLIEADEKIDAREFDLWRGMAAGSQAQGSWQNMKGGQAEILLKGLLETHLREKELVQEESSSRIFLKNRKVIAFASEPDIAIFQNDILQIAIEVKGGIDNAGVLERIGAAIKSLQRAKNENPKSVTILIMQEVSFSNRAKRDIELNKEAIDNLFFLENLLEKETERRKLFKLLGL
ncbi:MAG: hypothetical protein EPGJADBJ_04644 [Saprospiraceae bacterium]|nr:hypothetical protein [Saprospiraceae bacterium]